MSDNATPPQQGTTEVGGHRVALTGGLIATIGGGLLLVIFMAQNTEKVTFEFLTFEFTWPLWAMILLFAGIGALVWLGVGVLRRHRRRADRRDSRRA